MIGAEDPGRTPRVLLVTNMYPVPAAPSRGVFVRRQMEAVATCRGAPVERVLVGRTGAGGPAASRRAVRDAIARTGPDVIHVYYGLSGAALPLGLDLPLVLTLCGSDVLAWQARHHPHDLLERLVSVLTVWRARVVLVQSDVVRDALPRGLRDRVRVEPTGIDLGLFRPLPMAECRKRLGWPEHERVVLFPAQPSRTVKRYALAQEVVRRLQSRHRDPIRLRDLDGILPEDVPYHFGACDGALITSRWEAGPIVLQEALACGVPVVTTPAGYAAGSVRRPESLISVADSPEGLADALERCLEHDGARERPSSVLLRDEADYARMLAGVYRRAIRSPSTGFGDPSGAV